MSTTYLDNKAREILRNNDLGDYTVPTHGLYPYQWNWDSAFAAIGFATFDLDRGWTEIKTLMSGQWDSGMVPHIIFHKDDEGYFPGPDVWRTNQIPATSGITQPPVAATFAKTCFDVDPELGKPYLKELFPKLCRWHRWFHENRCESGAVAITHPWESGRDNAPDWDDAMANVDTSNVGDYQRRDTAHIDSGMRPKKEDYDRYLALLYSSRDSSWDEKLIKENPVFRVADPGMTFTLLRANRDLRQLGLEIGEPVDEIDHWIQQLEKGVELLWNEALGSYDSFDLLTGKYSNSISNASFFCWFAGIENAPMLALLRKVLDDVKYGVPSHPAHSDKFDPKRYWRGPTWIMSNTLVGMGLENQGHTELGEEIRQASRRLIEQSGFHEYFDPIDGSGAGGADFTWTAAVWLGWINADKTTSTNANG